MESRELRQAFLDFFATNGHTVVESSSLIPHGDPTLLFTNAGMVQFKDVFLGREQRPYRRATTAQKCVRAGGKHNDLDEVGRTARHHTFFEMMGNFSFGDYFKEEAIAFAWSFLTKTLSIAPGRLYVSVFEEDDEAARLWTKIAGIPSAEIRRFGAKDNFWAMGDTGPCGPCSEVFIDRGEAFACGEDCTFSPDCERFPEIWNLVFMQYNRDETGALTPLPRPSVDTGMGLERMTGVLEGLASNWETDLFRPLIRAVAELSGRAYDPGEAGFAHRVIADHARAGAFLVADGVLPANEGRGYVLRRILRRAVRMGRMIGLDEPFLASLLPVVQRTFSGAYPELLERAALVEGVLGAEEERFAATLEEGSRILERSLATVPSGGTLRGEDVFVLYDTYGFPVDLTAEIAEAEGKAIDRQGFGGLLELQRDRARSARDDSGGLLAALSGAVAGLPPTAFTGYQGTEGQGRVLALFSDGTPVEEAGQGADLAVVLDATPFYGEGGGQVGDTGVIEGPHGVLQVVNTRRLTGDRLVHLGRLSEGRLGVGDTVQAAVDAERRRAIMRNHTATHLLHRALREVLGDHVHQAGSVVAPDRLRFDFTHFEPLGEALRAEVEDRVNAWVLEDRPVTWQTLPLAEARSRGAMALFEEKYGDVVRMVTVEDRSVELCGGTHVQRTGEIGLTHIVSEGSVASGVRRVVAVTGTASLGLLRQKEARLEALSRLLKAPEEDVEARAAELQSALAATEEEVRAERRRRMAALLDEAERRSVGRSTLTALAVDGSDLEALRALADLWRQGEKSGILALASPQGDRVHLLVAVTRDLVDRGIRASSVFDALAGPVEGRGGGRPELAQGAGRRPAHIRAALDAARTAAQRALEEIDGRETS